MTRCAGPALPDASGRCPACGRWAPAYAQHIGDQFLALEAAA